MGITKLGRIHSMATGQPNSYKHTIPNLFLIGGAKCGSSTLSGWLGQHPQILLSVPKEPNFFQKDDFQRGMEWNSKKYFRGYNQEKWILDASPDYMHIKYVAPRIKQKCENPKFIVIVREPIARAYSHYQMVSNWRIGRMRETFLLELAHSYENFGFDRFRYEEEVMANVDYKRGMYSPTMIEQGLYYHNLTNWFNHFSFKDFFICSIDELILSPIELYSGLCKFLEIDEMSFVQEKRNIGVDNGKEPPLKELLKMGSLPLEIIKKLYMLDATALSEFTGKDYKEQWGYNKL